MSGNLAFDATQIEPQSEFTPLPAGEYLVMISDSEVKATKTGSGQYLQLSLQVLDAPYKGRLIFDRINIQNQSPTAQEIGQRALSALCHAVGILQVNDSAQLHNIPFIVRVSVRPDQQYGDSNEVKGYKSATGAKPSVSTRPSASAAAPTPPAQRTAATAPAKNGDKPAWLR